MKITVDEVLMLVNIALGQAEADNCTTGDGNGDGVIAIDDLVAATHHALDGCVDMREAASSGSD